MTSSNVRGLTTIALLKSNFDEGRDHIGMFSPFVTYACARLPADDFDVNDVQKQLEKDCGLLVPRHGLKILLRRACKAKSIRRDGGRYFKEAGLEPPESLLRGRREVEAEHSRLASGFIQYAEGKNLELPGESKALELLGAFLSDRLVTIVLAEDDELSEVDLDGPQDREVRVAAGFVEENLAAGSPYGVGLSRLVEGYVLQNALLLRDISLAKRRFTDLEIYLDTRCILGALGLEGAINEQATKEGFGLLRLTGARLSVFEITLEEVRRVLAVFERRLGTQEGRESLYQTDLTRNLITNRYTPADVKQAAALIERNLAQLGVAIRKVPPRVSDLVLDERVLTLELKRPHEGEQEPRVVHDVDCVAGILTIRAGQTIDSLDRARAIFCTTNGKLVGTVDAWYRSQGQEGVLPIIHQVRLTNVAWLKKPAAAPKLKSLELAALCSAALRPSRKSWSRFTKHLRSLVEKAELSDEESVAIMASAFTDRYLGELEEERDEIDAESLTEVVERVKAQYRGDADLRVGEAESRARSSEEERRQLSLSIEARARQLARIAVGFCYWASVAVLVWGLAFSLPGVVASVGGIAWWVKVSGVGAAAVVAVLAFLNLTKGWFLHSLRTRVTESLSRRFRGWFESPQP